MASDLSRVGIGAGSRVLFFPNVSVASVVTYWALRSLDAVIAVADPGAGTGERAYFAAKTGATVAFMDQRAENGPVPPGCRVFRLADEPEPRWITLDAPNHTAGESDTAVILFSSGTTGQPKAICHDHGSILGLHHALDATWAIGRGDTVLGALPFHTIYGLLFSAGTAIHSGAHLVLMDRFRADTALQMIEAHRVTTAALVPAMLLMMLSVDGRDRFDLSSLQMVYSASAPIAEADIARFRAFSGAEVLQNYGMTEIPGAVVERRGRPRRTGSVGAVSPGFEAVALDEAGRPLPPGQTGEIALRGPSMMQGYLDDPERTAARIRNGWVLTEDIGVVDTEGYVRLSGRRSDMIIRGGLNLSPVEIAGVIAEHEAVSDVAVVGASDPILGEVPVAVVVPIGATDTLAEALTAHCAARLSKPKVPDRIVFRAALPRNDGGKVRKDVLLAEIETELETER